MKMNVKKIFAAVTVFLLYAGMCFAYRDDDKIEAAEKGNFATVEQLGANTLAKSSSG